ncbi:hypothetical protein NBRC116583_11920 [Arenicella sp. 4NH20-0111]|uniref:amidohydrolase family protein n=1 Tax=Arenicella sp. 4NH20-0111 TaxID=3127648 RepID=UPI00310AC7F7
MKKINVIALILLLLLSSAHANASRLLIKNVSIISPERGAILEHQNVLIEDGRITSIGSNADGADVASRDIVLDATGKYLIPGLIDSHVHLSGVPGMLPFHEAKYPNVANQATLQIPRSYLYFGFTTVNDLFSSQETIDQWNQQELSPDAYFCSGVPLANGYPMAFIPKKDRFNSGAAEYFLYDERQKDDIPPTVDPADHAPETIVRKIGAAGASCIKAYYERGFGHLRNLPNPTVNMVRELVNRAHQVGLPVFMHGNTQESHAFAVDAGVDVIAHGMWHWNDKDGSEISKEIESLIDSIVSKGIGYQPTIQVIYGEQEMFNTSFFNDPMFLHSAPKALIDWYGSEEGGWMREKIAANLIVGKRELGYEEVKESYALPIRRAMRVLKQLADKDATLLFGSDTPSGPIFTQYHGMNGRLEMQRWVEAGVSLKKLFLALTIDNADTLGLADEIGTIEQGKTANLLLLNSNPLKSIKAYDDIDFVILNGKLIKRKTLSATYAN